MHVEVGSLDRELISLIMGFGHLGDAGRLERLRSFVCVIGKRRERRTRGFHAAPRFFLSVLKISMLRNHKTRAVGFDFEFTTPTNLEDLKLVTVDRCRFGDSDLKQSKEMRLNIFHSFLESNNFSKLLLTGLQQRSLLSSPVYSAFSVQKQIKHKAKKEQEFSKKTAVESFLLDQKKELSATEWKSIAADYELTLTNVGNILMARLLENNEPSSTSVLHSHAEDFVKKFTSVSVLSRYILLQKTEDEIFGLYEKIKALVKGVWNVEIAERIAIALSGTSRWREIDELIESVKIGGNPTNAMYSAYAKAAFLNGDYELGWKISGKLKYSCEAMEAFLQKCPQIPGNEEKEGAKIFQQYVDQEMEMSLVQKLFEFYSKLGYDCKLSKRMWRSSDGYCSNCQKEIKEEMTTEEFSSLKTKFYENVMKGGDVYLNSTPAELQNFLRFCEAKVPYDVVVDGLNAAMIPKGKNILPKIIESFLPNNKVLVIGRKHMDRQWKNLQMRLRGQPVDFYFLNDDSQDDVFMLYACFMSGPSTKFVTRDMLRDHLFRLGESEGPTFRKWLRLNQLNAEVIGVRVRIFGSEGRFLQWEECKGGHVPVKIEQNAAEEGMSQRNDRELWACFRKK